jgi:hypothetical protein
MSILNDGLVGLHRLIAVLIIATNFYFVPLNFIVVRDSGGPMGFGLLFLPVLLATNLALIPALLSFVKRFRNSVFLFLVNGIALLWNLSFLWLALTTVKMD